MIKDVDVVLAIDYKDCIKVKFLRDERLHVFLLLLSPDQAVNQLLFVRWQFLEPEMVGVFSIIFVMRVKVVDVAVMLEDFPLHPL